MANICVFCGSKAGHDRAYHEAARAIGASIAWHRHTLIYGGGSIGLMGILADAVLADGGQVIGVIPQSLADREIAHLGLSELRRVGSMHERKALMNQLADAFVAMPGGFGTLDELFETLTWAQLGQHAKPTGLLNVGGFFDPLLQMIDRMVEKGLLNSKYRELLFVDTEAVSLLERLLSHKMPKLDKVIDATET
jgi:uncharacterized protein (TIGR00730 family)